MRACVPVCAWTRGGPAPLGLNSHVRSDDPASQACRPAKGILYLAMTRTRYEEAILPRRAARNKGGRRGGRESSRETEQGGRLGCGTRMRQRKVESVHTGGERARREYRRRRFNQRGAIGINLSSLARGFQRMSGSFGIDVDVTEDQRAQSVSFFSLFVRGRCAFAQQCPHSGYSNIPQT